MTLSVQGIRSFLANQSTPPLSKFAGGSPVASEANQVQDTVNFSEKGTARAIDSLELLRARFDVAQTTLPSRRDDAVLKANRTNFNIFRNAIERFREAENLVKTDSASGQPSSVTAPQVPTTEAAEKTGIAIPAAAPRQKETLFSSGPSTRAAVAGSKESALGNTPLYDTKPEKRLPPAKDTAPSLFTPLSPRQPDTAFTAGFRDRDQGESNQRPLPRRSLEEVPTVANRRFSPAQATAPTPPAQGIQAPREGRAVAVNDQQDDNKFTRQPPDRENGRVAVGGNREDNGQIPPANGIPPATEANQNRANQGNASPAAGLQTGEALNKTPEPAPTNPVQEGTLGGPVAFAFVQSFQGRTGEPNPESLPRAAPLNFPTRQPNENGGTGGVAAPANGPTTNQPPPAENEPAAANMVANHNPTVVPINRNAALSLYARLGGFGRTTDVSQEPGNAPISLVA